MQLTIDIQNESMVDKIIKILEVFKNDGVVIQTIDKIKENQQDIQEYDVDYEKSFQYKLDRADFIAMKEVL